MKNLTKAFIACGLLLTAAFVACENAQEVLENPDLALDGTVTPSTELLEGYADFENNATPIIKGLSNLYSDYNPENPGTSESKMEEYEAQLIASSATLLEQNGINVVSEFGSRTDPRIAVAGLALMEYQQCAQTVMTRADVGGCLLNAIGVGDLINGGAKLGIKQVTKKIVKAALKKAIPYVGWAIGIAEFAHCMYN